VDQLTGIENLTGSDYADTLVGNGGDNVLRGQGGADSLSGGAGHDFLFAAERDGKADALDCGDGTDVAVFRAGDTAVNCEKVRALR
jgi:Ca2+-binding RTX toxin-like protein